MWKIKVRHFFYSLPFLAVSPFILSSGAVFASSYSLTINSQSDFSSDILVYQDSSATMSGTPLLNFAPVYVEIEQKTTGFSSSMYRYCGSNGYGILTNGQGSGFNFTPVDCIHTLTTFSAFNISAWWTSSYHNYILLIRPSQFSSLANYPDNYIKYTFYDSLPDSDCPECPPIPTNPYDDKLDSINRSILIVSATALVIYFFYSIYGMFFGGVR